jgi:Ca-activated chloride channel family protein
MVGFATPELLWLLPLAPLLAWWWLRRRRPALRYPDVGGLAGLPRGRAGRARWGGALLRGLAVASLVVAAAGPRTPDLKTRLPAEGIAVVLALDVSGSMATPDFAWDPAAPPTTRLEAARRAFRLFVAGGAGPDGTPFDGRPADQVGLVVFAAVPQTACPLTLNHSVLLKVLDEQQPRDGIDAGTNVGDALAEGVIRLDAAGQRRKVLILLSDGEHNVLRDGPNAPLKPFEAAHLAESLGIPVYTIDCGGPPPAGAAAAAVQQREDGRRVLEGTAELTGGRAFAANSGADLRAVYQVIDALERRPVESFQYRRHHEFYPHAAAAGLGLLAVVQLLERTRWRRIP